MGVAHSSNFHGVQRLATDGKQGRKIDHGLTVAGKKTPVGQE